MASQTAIAYGTDRVRLLEFDGSGKRVRVLQVVDVPLERPEGDGQELTAEDLAAEAIAAAADEAGVVMQHLVLRKTRDKSHILAVAIRKDDLLDRFDVLEEADMDPMFVDLDVFALLNALHHTGVAGEHERCVVIDVADHATKLLFLVDGSLFAVRCWPGSTTSSTPSRPRASAPTSAPPWVWPSSSTAWTSPAPTSAATSAPTPRSSTR